MPVNGDASRTHLPERNLDVLRATAVLCVFADHIATTWNISLPVLTTWDLGRIGVLLFFVHTALVLMGSLERDGPRQAWVSKFYVRRAFRIYPLAIVVVIAVVLLGVPPHVTSRLVVGTPVDANTRTIVANGALIQNLVNSPDVLGVLWSLPLEVQMYLALPALFLIAKRGVRPMVIGVAIASALGLLARFSGWPGMWRLTVVEFAPCFMAGVLAYSILRARTRPVLPSWAWMPVMLATVPIFLVMQPTSDSPERGWLFCWAVGCAIPLTAELPESALTKVAQVVCRYSYGIYLLHQPVLWFSFSVLGHRALLTQWMVCAVLLCALPVVAYRYIENPAIQFGKKLVSHVTRRAASGAAVPSPLEQ